MSTQSTRSAPYIGFCKIGKSVKFTPSSYSPHGGDNEPGALLQILANNNPDITYVIVGRSNFGKLDADARSRLFPYGNVTEIKYTKTRNDASDDIFNLQDALKERGITLSAIVMMVGQLGQVSIPNRIKQVLHPELTSGVINMTKNYASPLVMFCNDNPDIPVLEIINDPRCTLTSVRDFINDPVVSLSQYDYSYTKRSIDSYEDQTRTPVEIPVKYAHMEKIFMYGRDAPDRTTNPLVNFMVVLNEGKPTRYGMLKTWVLDHIQDVHIYGKWMHPEAESDPRFVGSLKLEDLQHKLRDVRCTFIIPIAPGWVTSKYIEMIHAGVVPFLHPTYDTQNHVRVPKFLRPDSPEELMSRVAMLKDDAFYMKTITGLQDQYCTPENYDGTVVNYAVMSEITPGYTAPDLSGFTKHVQTKPALDGWGI